MTFGILLPGKPEELEIASLRVRLELAHVIFVGRYLVRAKRGCGETENDSSLGCSHKVPIVRCENPVDFVKANVSTSSIHDTSGQLGVEGQVHRDEGLAKALRIRGILKPVLGSFRSEDKQSDFKILDRLDEATAWM